MTHECLCSPEGVQEIQKATVEKITKISETEVVLREIVQDAAGEWIERTSNLMLQERGR